VIHLFWCSLPSQKNGIQSVYFKVQLQHSPVETTASVIKPCRSNTL
jgi:hypothetical protein